MCKLCFVNNDAMKEKQVYGIVKEIPKGKVMTYGQIGKTLGINPRQVGKILHNNIDPKNIPCHRVVNSRGKVAAKYAFGGEKIQSKKLMREGVEFADEKADLVKCLYKNKVLDSQIRTHQPIY